MEYKCYMLHDTKRMTHDIIHAIENMIHAKRTHRQSVTFFAVRGRLPTKLSDLLVPDSAIHLKASKRKPLRYMLHHA